MDLPIDVVAVARITGLKSRQTRRIVKNRVRFAVPLCCRRNGLNLNPKQRVNEMHPLSNLYSIVAQAREHRGLSIRKLAWLAKVSPTTIQHIEQGSDCRMSIVEKVLKVFDLKAIITEPEVEGWDSVEKKINE